MEQLYVPQFLTELNEALNNKEKEQFLKFWNMEWNHIYSLGNENYGMQLFFTLVGLLLTDIIHSGSSIESIYGEDFKIHNELYTISKLEEKVKKLLYYYELWLETENDKKMTQSKIIAEKARVYIQEHYMDGGLNITEISKELYINQTYLRKMFKDEMGMTLLEFLTKYRMHLAKQLILKGEYNLSQIAEMVGYNDVSYFSKCFKKYYHVSPKQMTKKDYQTFN